MPKYTTPQQYRLADDGISLTDVTDVTLARFISRAESDLDSFSGFSMQNGGFEPHAIWSQMQFDERTRRFAIQNAPVPARQVIRYRIQVSNLPSTGAGFFANISPADASINVTDEYVEIVPLQSITYSLTPVLVQLGLRPPIVQMDIEVGWFLPVIGETLSLYATTSTTSTYIAMRGFWATTYTQSLATQPNTLPPVPPVLYVNGVAQSSSLYSINATEGTVTFNPALSSNPVVTANYTYQIPDNVRDACIAQTSYLLGKRRLNQLGMSGVGTLKNADLEIRSIDAFPARFPQNLGPLCELAANKLADYKTIAIA